MSYYSEMHKAKTRVRTHWLPQVQAGNKILFEEILYDLDSLNFGYSEKGIYNYIKRACTIEGYDFDGEIIQLITEVK